MADFDLTQTDAQVQSILNDGQNMQGAGAQTTLTTESVLLKDVNGNYHKILKSSFTEAIRDTLAGLLVNNDKGTTISQIAAIASGDFGSITPANLASVLGELDTNHGNNFYSSKFYDYAFTRTHSCATYQSSDSTSATIPNTFFGGGTEGKCSILIITQNTKTPSIFVLGRKTVVATIYDGDAIHQSDLEFNSDGSLTVTKIRHLALYFRVLVMEW